MRLRNIRGTKEKVESSKHIINNYKDYRGKWKSIFNNKNPIHIEIGMGKGRYILENALNNPNINYIGIEKYDSVLYKAIKKIDEYTLDNLKLIRCDAKEIKEIFNKEIDTIYLNFPDPWHKDRHHKRRLTSLDFLKLYDHIFKDKCKIIMKTDNRNLFEYSIVTLSSYGYIFDRISLDLHNSKIENIITTEYEEKFKKEGKSIYMLEVHK